MYLPFISKPSSRWLVKRKGGGGGGRGGGGKGSSIGKTSSGGSKGSSSSGTGSTSKTKTGSISSGKSSTYSTSTYSSSNTSPRLIPFGQPFAGRTEGGASRAEIFGTRTYGSGYPGMIGRGVSGRALPFFYWPIVWPVVIGVGAADALYLHDEQEYGSPTNTSRPGGALAYATFPSNSSSPPTVVFRVLADNATVISLISDLTANCSAHFSNSSFAPPNGLSTTSTPYAPPYTFSNTTGPANPQPEQVVQYYRGSTIALTLDSYNNTATYSADGAPDSPLPVLGTMDVALLDCLNTTIGLAAPLVSPAGQNVVIPAPLLYMIWTVVLLAIILN